MRLDGKVAGITGGGLGFGRAIALAFAREGADVAVCDLNLDDAQDTARGVEAQGRRAKAARLDVTDTPRLVEFVDGIVKDFGRIDIWVGNAGMAGGRRVEEETEEFWRRMMELNLNAVFFGAQAAGRHMLRQGGGAIVNTASTFGERAVPMRSAYCVAKSGVIMLTQCLAVEWAGRGVRVNAIGPSFADTRLFRAGRTPESTPVEKLLARVPMGRFVKPEEIAEAAVFLASDEASFVTGQCLMVDGGYTPYGGA